MYYCKGILERWLKGESSKGHILTSDKWDRVSNKGNPNKYVVHEFIGSVIIYIYSIKMGSDANVHKKVKMITQWMEDMCALASNLQGKHVQVIKMP